MGLDEKAAEVETPASQWHREEASGNCSGLSLGYRRAPDANWRLAPIAAMRMWRASPSPSRSEAFSVIHATHAPAGHGRRRRTRARLVVGIIVAVVALSHALRIYMEWPVTIANWSVPKSVSWIALIVAGGLALFAFRFMTENGKH
jgi:hypothetical protein